MIKRLIKKFIPNFVLQRIRKQSIPHRLSTSISDNQVYPDFCYKASIDTATFINFRRSPIYQQILEAVTEQAGLEYLKEIRHSDKNLLDYVDGFRNNDDWGNPKIIDFPDVGMFSPSTLRYVKVLADLRDLFGDFDSQKVCEIGVGYGGQCRVINSISHPSEYTLVDIKPALMLSQRYLDNYILNSIIKFKTMNELEKSNYDLLISNYAFTELPRDIQDVYLNKVILNSKNGYITYNQISPDHFESYSKDELLKIIPNSYVLPEKPLTHKYNCIIVWKA